MTFPATGDSRHRIAHALVGGFTSPARQGRASGLSLLRCEADDSVTRVAELAMPNPTWLARHPTRGNCIYASHSDTGLVSTVSCDPEATTLTLLGQQSTGGSNVAHLACAPDGAAVVAASFGSGHLSLFPVAADGMLSAPTAVLRLDAPHGPHPAQSGCQPHQISFTPDARYACVPDRGTDRIWLLAVDTSRLSIEIVGSTSALAGAGPRHIAWHPRRPVAYVVNELDSSVVAHGWNGASATLVALCRASTVPPGHVGRNLSAAVCVSPNGRWLYVSNRGQDAIAILAVSDDGARIDPVSWEIDVGITPRFMKFDDDARLWVASQGSNALCIFDADPKTGALHHRACIETPSPACVLC